MASLRIKSGSPTDIKEYMGRLVKLIPSEVVGIYLTGVAIIPEDIGIAHALWAFACLGLVVLFRAYTTSDSARKKPPQWSAVAVSSVSFLIWSYTLGGPFAAYGVWLTWLGPLLILVWTPLVPFIQKLID